MEIPVVRHPRSVSGCTPVIHRSGCNTRFGLSCSIVGQTYGIRTLDVNSREDSEEKDQRWGRVKEGPWNKGVEVPRRLAVEENRGTDGGLTKETREKE